MLASRPVALSKTQIDRLGERLRSGTPTEGDLRELDEYRRSFGPTYEEIVETIRSALSLQPSGRPAKTTQSIVDKLRRESIRLSQMQDIAGCRVIVSDRAEQDRIVDALLRSFTSVDVVDRREKPSNGYRAVHVIVRERDRLVEVQVRTRLQHLWAQCCENLSDWVDPSIKYGGGPASVVDALLSTSELIAGIETYGEGPEGIEGQLSYDPITDLIDVFVRLLAALGGIMKKR